MVLPPRMPYVSPSEVTEEFPRVRRTTAYEVEPVPRRFSIARTVLVTVGVFAACAVAAAVVPRTVELTAGRGPASPRVPAPTPATAGGGPSTWRPYEEAVPVPAPGHGVTPPARRDGGRRDGERRRAPDRAGDRGPDRVGDGARGVSVPVVVPRGRARPDGERGGVKAPPARRGSPAAPKPRTRMPRPAPAPAPAPVPAPAPASPETGARTLVSGNCDRLFPPGDPAYAVRNRACHALYG
ncbi:hypothetical protein [Thermocatellispora tengchongensis]|uniref:hypothetical protein n=1 Tax=Thermocatellispora tengchongensis TaxID=1073253 RepID=UPI003637D343